MKKKWLTGHPFGDSLKKFMRIMRLTILLLFGCMLTVSANSYAQKTRLDINMSNTSIRDLFGFIEENSEFVFLYRNEDFNVNKKVVVSLKDATINQILDEALRGENVSYDVYERQVVIRKAGDVINAQQKRDISGTVKDATGAPIPGATVLVKGTTVGGLTDMDGKFKLSIPGDSKILVISFVGMKTQEIAITGLTQVNAVLEETVGIEEVVAVGYGKSSRKNLTSSVTSVKAEELNRGAITDVGQLLQGKVAGLNISNSGDPNKSAAIVLRGASTINSPGGPFFVIDGVPGADIKLVAPDDIASIDILKDAAATAIYGNRAAAGIIMVTTKKGSKGKTQISYNGYVGIETVSSKLSLMDADQHRAYVASQNLSYNPADDLGANTDWQKAVMRDMAISHNHNVSFSGGGDHHTYSANLNYVNREGIMKLSNQERYIARLSVEQMAFDDKLKFNLNVTNTKSISDYVPMQNTVLEQIGIHLPVSPVYNASGTWFENFNTTGYYNPVGLIENAKSDNTSDIVVGSLSAEAKLPFGLTYNILVSYQGNESTSNSFYGSYYGNYSASSFYTNPDPGTGSSGLVGSLFGVNGSAYRSAYQSNQKNLETYLTWKQKIGMHDINAVVGFSWVNSHYSDGIQSSSTNFPSDFIGYNNLSLGNPYAISSYRIGLAGGFEEKRLISDFARLNYNFDDRILIQGSIRRDGSSVFGANYRWGYFPSVGGAWRVINESFMKNQKVLSDLKLRASYGVTGNAEGIGAFNAKIVYGITGTYYNNGVMDNSYGPIQGANPDLRWERTSTSNLGFDFGFLNNVVTGSVDVYEKLTSDMLFAYSVSPSLIPGGKIWANGGSISNKGIELVLTSTPVKAKDFSWTTSVNLAHNKNEITSLTNPYSTGDSILYISPRAQGQTGATVQILKVGKPIGQFFSFMYEGKDANGLSQFRKADGTLTTAPLYGKDYFYVGDAQPKLLAGWSNTFKYKRFDLNVFFRGVFGNKIFNVSRANLSYTPNATTNNLSSYVTTDDKITDTKNNFFSNRYIEDGSYIRLDNATLGYDVNAKLKGIKSLRVYVTAENLLTITKYKGIDPEINQGGTAPGVDSNNFYPKTRVFMFGLNVEF
jgi:TonB-linked SusC/RagA family outer membrane protein